MESKINYEMPHMVYIAPDFQPKLSDFIKANNISDVMIYGSGWKTVEHFQNRLNILQAVINCWIDKMPY